MSTSRAFAFTAALSRATTFLMFALIVLGAVVRATGSGLACPDWPLCEGRIIPRLEYHVLIEWGHRTVALLVSLLLLATSVSVLGRRPIRARLGGIVALALVLLFAQVLLGALTVWKLLSPSVVSSHLAVALLLFVTMLTLALRAQDLADAEAVVAPGRALEAPGQAVAVAAPAPGLGAAFAIASVLAYAQAVLGGWMSTQHAVGACPDWPTCRGEWFPAMSGAVGIHMAHRLGGYLVALVVLGVAIAGRGSVFPARIGGRLSLTLVTAQVILGVCTVLLQAPVWLSAMHLANAVALLAVLIVTTYRLAPAAAPAARFVPMAAR